MNIKQHITQVKVFFFKHNQSKYKNKTTYFDKLTFVTKATHYCDTEFYFYFLKIYIELHK